MKRKLLLALAYGRNLITCIVLLLLVMCGTMSFIQGGEVVVIQWETLATSTKVLILSFITFAPIGITYLENKWGML